MDTLYPYYRLIEGGYRPVVAGPEKRPFQMVMHEVRPGWTITKEWEGYTINADVAFSEIKPEQYVGIFISGCIHINEPCVIDRHMYSGRTYHDNGHFIGPWIKALNQVPTPQT